MAKKYLVTCPECGDELELDYFYEEGDIITCYGCDSELEVVTLKPLKLRIVKEDSAEKEKDDEDDEDDGLFENFEGYDEGEDLD